MTTAARTTEKKNGHWYDSAGIPRYEVPKKDGSGMRATTLADARKNNWLASVTTILGILEKPALTQWKNEQAALAVLTSPRKEGEAIDAFVYRVLHEERQQDQEGQIARDKGTELHAAMEAYFTGQVVPDASEPWVRPAIEAIIGFGPMASSEVVLVGNGYAGRTDLIQDCEGCWRIWDWKSTKKLPDPTKGGAWSDHKLQLSAYARAWADKLQKAGALKKPIIPGNLYISTINPGEFVICEHEEPWEETFERGFRPLLVHWMWANNYWPVQPAPIDIPQPHTLAQAAAQEPVDVANMRAHYIAANARVEELEKKLQEALKAEPLRPTPPPAPELAPEAQAAPVPGAMPTNTNLPTHDKEGRKLSWTVATASGPVPPKK